jgi:hypothetical protein
MAKFLHFPEILAVEAERLCQWGALVGVVLTGKLRTGDLCLGADILQGKQLCRIWVFAEVTMKNVIFWDVAPGGLNINRRFGAPRQGRRNNTSKEKC